MDGRAIRKNHQEPSLEPSGGETPPDLHQVSYATKILEELVMTHNRGNLDAVVDALNLEIRQGKSKAAAFEFIRARALDDLDAGVVIDKWYFIDWGKHRNGSTRKASANEEFRRRLSRNES